MLSSAIVGAGSCLWNHDLRLAARHSGDHLYKDEPSSNRADLIAMGSDSWSRSIAGIITRIQYSASCHALGSSAIML